MSSQDFVKDGYNSGRLACRRSAPIWKSTRPCILPLWLGRNLAATGCRRWLTDRGEPCVPLLGSLQFIFPRILAARPGVAWRLSAGSLSTVPANGRRPGPCLHLDGSAHGAAVATVSTEK